MFGRPEGPVGANSSWNMRNQRDSPFYAPFTTVSIEYTYENNDFKKKP